MQVQTLYKQIEIPSGSAHLCAAVRIESFMPLPEFRQRMDLVVQLMCSCPRAPGVDRIYVPGEIEFETEQRRRTEGIPINAELHSELTALAQELGVKSVFR